ncbi:MAG: Ig-like domain-containing protein, partial [Omnitrophica WOR_2 bacterium]
MNRIKHTFILLLISLLILLFATRCGGKKTAGTPASPTVKATTISTTSPTLTPTLTPTVDFGLLKGADSGAPLAPKVTGQQPEPMEELPVNGSFNISFDQPMDQQTTAAAWKVTGPDGKAVPGKVSWPDARILRFNPDKTFLPASTYTATLSTEARSASGKVLQDAAILNFTTTGDLQISQVSPADGSNDVESGALITVVFNRPVVPLVTAEDVSKLPNPLVITPTISGHADWLNTSVFVFHPDKPLYGSTTYHVTVKAGLEDQSGGQLAKSLTWQFTTIAPSIDVFNLPGLLTSPPEGYTNIPLDQTFELNFRQAMDRASTESVFSITSNAGKPVEGKFTWNESSNQFVFKPNSRLSLGTDYTLQLDKSAQAATGGGLRDGLIWHFKTVEPPGIANTNPANGQVQSQFYPQLEINFASPMKQSTLKDKVIITPKPNADLQWMYTDWGMYFYGLEPSTQYQVEVQPGMEDIYGNKITTSYKFHFTTASAPPEAYLVMPWTPALIRADGPQQFYATYINIQKVDFQLYRLTPEEFASLMGGNVAWSNYNPSDTALVRKWSVTNKRGINQRALDPITLTDSQNNPLTPGIYYLGLDTGEIKHETRVLDARILIVATANLTLKKTTSEALIWLTDLDSGSPISQVPVKIYGPSFNRIGEGVTDKDGLLHVSLPVPNDPGERRYALASTEGSKPVFGLAVSDYSFDLDPSNYGVSVDYYIKPQMPVAYVYTDRPIYRPDQTVYFKGIVRLNDDLKYSLPDQKEVKVSISSYDAQVYTQTLTLAGSGSFEGQFRLDAQAALGSYAINVQFPGQEMVIGSVSFSVAEYRKPEFLLSVKASPQDIHAGDNFSATVKADFYSGGAVANADVSWVLNATTYNFNPAGPLGQSGYSFTDFDRDVNYYGPPAEPASKILAQGKGVTNEQGELHITLPADLSGSKSSQQLT